MVEIICVKSVKADCLGLKAESFFEGATKIVSFVVTSVKFGQEPVLTKASKGFHHRIGVTV